MSTDVVTLVNRVWECDPQDLSMVQLYYHFLEILILSLEIFMRLLLFPLFLQRENNLINLEDNVVHGLNAAGCSRWSQGNNCFWTSQGSCTYESTEIVTAGMKPAQA